MTKHEKCSKCLGKGSYMVTLGVAGQDRYLSYIDTEWHEPQGPFKCLACHETGYRKAKPTQPSKQITNTDTLWEIT
ncbi:unnamed protein product [marine sediment metagenome]|uniref:Uncharacterized protein n=1 Tax=marine sediment metagenome TaxID=412755 RepID=X0SJS1_9ZZZZ